MVTVTITPNGYEVSYGASVMGAPQPSDERQGLKSCSEPSTVSMVLDGLNSSTTYTATVGISSYAGTATSSAAFTTLAALSQVAPAFTFSLHASVHTIVVGEAVSITGHVGNRVALDDEGDPPLIYLQSAPTAHGPWNNPGQNETYASATNHLSWMQQTPDRNTWFRIETPKSNFPMRAESVSRPTLVYVTPSVELLASRPHDSREVQAEYTARVHELSHYHTQLVYFYKRPIGSRAISRLGSARLKYLRSSEYPELHAVFDYNDTGAGQIFSCVRHALLPDMGKPFRAPWCGARTLPSR
jgi:hypothetical protein